MRNHLSQMQITGIGLPLIFSPRIVRLSRCFLARSTRLYMQQTTVGARSWGFVLLLIAGQRQAQRGTLRVMIFGAIWFL
jgi:hypothetical protein